MLKSRDKLYTVSSVILATGSLIIGLYSFNEAFNSRTNLDKGASQILAQIEEISIRSEKRIVDMEKGDAEFRQVRDGFKNSIANFQTNIAELSDAIISSPDETKVAARVALLKNDIQLLDQKVQTMIDRLVLKPEDVLSMFVLKERIERIDLITQNNRKNDVDIISARIDALKADIERQYQVVIGIVGVFAFSVFGIFAAPFLNRKFGRV